MKYERGRLSAEGKTKKIWSVLDHRGLVIVEQKNTITKFDDPEKTEEFATKAVCSTTTTSRVFELLRKAGIPVAYQEQISDTEFLAQRCVMIPLEAVIRRFSEGSFLKRHPEFTSAKGQTPHRFHRLVTEFFLKTTKGKLLDSQGKTLVNGLDPQQGEEDPLIQDPYIESWQLFHAKKPAWDSQANLGRTVDGSLVVCGKVQEKIQKMETILREVFLVLEGAWNILGFRFIDMKIEFGVTRYSNLVVADVVDNDSWRLRDNKWEELSKEAFRQDEALTEVEQKYGLVASLVERFRIPNQVLVLWKGSTKDAFLEVFSSFNRRFGVNVEEITLSGHKSPRKCLDKLDEIIGDYPDGGVIVVKVGRSNGLGPMLAARSSWPVIAIPATMEENPEDVWSSIRMPSCVPLATIWPGKNAMLMVMNILAAKNPLLYMKRQKQIEELDI